MSDRADEIRDLEAIANERDRVTRAPVKHIPKAGVGLTQRCPNCGASYRIVGDVGPLPPCHYCKTERITE